MNRPTLVLLVGVLGSGKTTYAKDYIKLNDNTLHLSSDTICEELYGDESIQGNPAEVFSLMQKRAVEALNEGKDVLYDATNVTRKDRASIIGICPRFAKIECHIIWAPIETCIERDAARERTVGKAVIDKMLKRFQAPYYDEGIDEIQIIGPDNFNQCEYVSSCVEPMHISHDNPHHTLDIHKHCIEAYNYVKTKYPCEYAIHRAANIHDIGKPYVKAFVDSKGNPCEVAHYYQHQCLSAWMSYGFFNVTPKIAWLISTHMDPYMNTKYYRSLPTFLKKDIDLLHEADLNAH